MGKHKEIFKDKKVEIKKFHDTEELIKNKSALEAPQVLKRSNTITYSGKGKKLSLPSADNDQNFKDIRLKQDDQLKYDGDILESNIINREIGLEKNEQLMIMSDKEARIKKLKSQNNKNQEKFFDKVEISGKLPLAKALRRPEMIRDAINFQAKTARYLLNSNNSKEMNDILTAVLQLGKMLTHTIQGPQKDNAPQVPEQAKKNSKEAEVARKMEILRFYTEVVLDKCSDYMLVKKPLTSNGKKRYELVRELFKQTYYLKDTLGNQLSYRSNSGEPLFEADGKNQMKVSDFLKELTVIKEDDYTRLKQDPNKDQYTITFNNGKASVLKKADFKTAGHLGGVFLAKYLGVDNSVTDFNRFTLKAEDGTYVHGCIKQINTGNTLGDIRAKVKNLNFTEEAYEQLFRIQLLDILTGNKRDPEKLEVRFGKSISDKGIEEYCVEKIIGDGEMINFTTETEMNLDSLNFKSIDPRIVSNLKSMASNNGLIKSFGLDGEKLAAFKSRLSALIKRIDTVTKTDEYKDHDPDAAFSFNDKKWEYEHSYSDKLKLGPETMIVDNTQFHSIVQRKVNLQQLNNSQLRSEFFKNRELKRDNNPGIGRSFLSKLRHIGATIIGLPALIIKKSVSFIAGKFATLTDVGSKDIIRDRIPGKLNIDDSTIDTQTLKDKVEQGEAGQEVIDDTRMLPLAFEESVPIGEMEPPYISLKIDQPKEGSDQTVNGDDMGHAMIEIEYSRYDKKSKEMRRYRSRFGFYPKGGFVNPVSGLSMASNGMVVPGVILNDRDHSYNVGRRFRATNQQINKMILFANDYAQNGGYNYVTRSCSTFAVEALKHVGVDTGDTLQKDKIDASTMAKTAMTVDAVIPVSVPLSVYNNFGHRKKGQRDDLSYQRVGQKMLTQKEYERLFVTHHDEFKGYTPAFLAENIRAFNSGDVEDTILSREFGEIEKLEIRSIKLRLPEYQNNFIGFIKKEFKDEIDTELLNRIDNCLWSLYNDLQPPFERYLSSELEGTKDTLNGTELKKNSIKEMSAILATMGQYVNKIYNVTLKRDKRANIETHHFISIIEAFKDRLIYEYSEFKFEMLSPDNNEMVKAFFADKYEIKDSKDEQPGDPLAYNPIELCALVEVYGDFNTAIKNAKRYDELIEKDKHGGVTEAEASEFRKIDMVMDLKKPFKKAHMYYFESETLHRQLANIAFNSIPSLSKDISFHLKESPVSDLGVEQRFRGPAQFYQSIAFSKIFTGAMPDKSGFNYNDPNAYVERFDEKAAEIVSERSEEFGYILEAIYKGMKGNVNKFSFCNEFKTMLIESFLKPELAKVYESERKKYNQNIIRNDEFSQYATDKGIKLNRLNELAGAFYDRKNAELERNASEIKLE